MSATIYSDIYAEIVMTEYGDKSLYIYDGRGKRYSPNLILPNLSAVKKLRDYLNKIVKDKSNKKYFDIVGN